MLHIVQRDGVVARRDHPELAGAMARLVRDGVLAPVLPGVYGPPRATKDVRLAALGRWAPDAVVVGRTAAQLTYWPDLGGEQVECALRWEREPQHGFRFSRRRIPPELVVRRRWLQVTSPALTALDLSSELGGDPVDQALRTRAATLAGLWDAVRLTPARHGNQDRRRLLLDSRDQPWSAAERLAHRLLRQSRVKGWRGNHPVTIDGQRYFLDIAFPAQRLVVEIDGRLHEDDANLFESDRWRQNALVGQGWTVLRFTWRMLQGHPEQFVETVRAEVRAKGSAS
ncbi:Very-short-patch-repair endonuclease [Microlunatus flavus]|uniref:Very-short-patch-repair endonuclease n=1 Tax=Microlunatus flavus TaxID=1036181 RepID=A0A1H9AZ43_9ACTN|nr:Very-short-patch-repair endonuclease [Microlunatus flavus]